MKKLKDRKNENTQLLFNQVSEVKVSYHPHFKACERPQVSESKIAYNIFTSHWNFGTIEFQEDFKLLLLNRNNRVLGIFHLASGGMAGVVVDPKVIFSIALKCCASGMVLAHNHPSGNLKPSPEDLSITKKLQEAGKLLDINIMDHLILTANSYFSFADEGIM